LDENQALLKIKDLRVHFNTYAGRVQAVRGVSFELRESEVLAIVGESGCGKSVTAQSILQLNPVPPTVVDGGSIELNGVDLLKYSDGQMRKVRGRDISMIFQDPMTSLNPTARIGRQITEAILKHQKVSRKEADKQAEKMLHLVGFSNPKQRMRQYPHEFSGGMRQRAMIAMALVCKPKILIADEPTTALDVTIQSEIVDLLLDLREKFGTAILIITHDMGVVADIADRVAVMYAGVIIEQGGVRDLFYHPQHPYTWGLLNSVPKMNHSDEPLIPIQGTPPDLLQPPLGCPFAARCPYCMAVCHENMPDETMVKSGHIVKCWLKHEFAPKTYNHFEWEYR
jgi:oligopeptide transport system ATP-binding protein